MEIYILDPLFRRNAVVDKFESLIWTERWNEVGDFQVDIRSNVENRTRFYPGVHLAINNSHRVMTVETLEDSVTSDGKEALTATGRSLEAVMEDRVIKKSMALDPTDVFTGTPGAIAREMFDHICRAPGALSSDDVIPLLVAGSFLDTGNIPEPTESITWEQQPEQLLSAIQNICKSYDLGFRLVREYDESKLYFDIYTGNDRTTKQTVLPPVVFSPSLDNVQNLTEFKTIEKSKNVAYVFAPDGTRIVYGEGVDPSVSGFDRRVLVVNTEVNPAAPTIQEGLKWAGEQALRKARGVEMFDGEINQNSTYKYGSEYDLGDLVEMRNKDGVVTEKRVTEQIFVADAEGERSYPTLSAGDFIGVDTWVALSNDSREWASMTTEHWTDM